MDTDVQVHFFGSLRNEAIPGGTSTRRLPLQSAASLETIFGRLNIPRGRVQMVMVNHRAVGPEARIHPGDRLALFPPEYPIFADWIHFRIGR